MWWMVLWSTRLNTAGCTVVKATGAAQKWLRGWWRCPVKAAGVLSRAGHWRPWRFLLHGWYWEPWLSNLFSISWSYWPPQWSGWEWGWGKSCGNCSESLGKLAVQRALPFYCERNLQARESPLCWPLLVGGWDNAGKMTLMLLSNFWEGILNISFIVL